MVRSMIAGVAGLKAHQSKMDVIGNNIANVNTWGFKGYSYNFKDSMYTNSIKSAAGSDLAGAAGGRNASQVGYGSQLSSISNVFENGAPSPSANPMDCMIDGTGFFLVGNMVNGNFTDIASSGLYLSRVGIFRVDDNNYLVDDQRSYVYGYAVEEGTGIPETPASAGSAIVNDIPVDTSKIATTGEITIGGITVQTSVRTPNKLSTAINEWIAYVTKFKVGVPEGAAAGTAPTVLDAAGQPTTAEDSAGNPITDKVVTLSKVTMGISELGADLKTVKFNVKSKEPGKDTETTNVFPAAELLTGQTGDAAKALWEPTEGSDLIPAVLAVYSDELSALKIPIDENTGLPYKLNNYSINENGVVVGVDELNRTIVIGQVALVSVQNPNGLEKTNGYYYQIGENAGDVYDVRPGTGPAGIIKPGNLEMANVDLANEFANIITTQRGFQANSKIITVTDEMLQELVNMKR